MIISDRLSTALSICAITAVAALVLFQTPYVASNLDITPDSAEYAIGANHIARDGAYYITVEGRKLPPRYNSWFPILLSPAYKLAGTAEIGNGILVVTIFAVAGVLAAFAIGRRISGNYGGLAAAAILLLLPDYTWLARRIMSDVPATALVLLAAAAFMRMISHDRDRRIYAFALGLLAALACAIRPPLLTLLLPPLILFARRRLDLTSLLLITFPAVAVQILNLLHNYSTFGSPLRNGYNFWCPVPYDYAALTFSLSYVIPNLTALIFSPVAALCAIALLSMLLLRRNQNAGTAYPAGLNLFLFCAGGPFLLIHLLYFYQDTRFFLPLAALLAAICGGLAGRLLAGINRAAALLILSAALAASIATRLRDERPQQGLRQTADAILTYTPDDAAIVTAANPVYLEFMTAEHTRRKIIPLSRRVEYASKLLAPVRFPTLSPPPLNWGDHRCKGLINAGAPEAYTEVAEDQPELLTAYILAGRRVYITTYSESADEAESARQLAARFNVIGCAPGLLELSLKRK